MTKKWKRAKAKFEWGIAKETCKGESREEKRDSKKRESKEEKRNTKPNVAEKPEFIPIDTITVSSIGTSISR